MSELAAQTAPAAAARDEEAARAAFGESTETPRPSTDPPQTVPESQAAPESQAVPEGQGAPESQAVPEGQAAPESQVPKDQTAPENQAPPGTKAETTTAEDQVWLVGEHSGVLFRVAVEYSALRYGTAMSGGREADGINTHFERKIKGFAPTWGGRALLGWGMGLSPNTGIAPRLSVGVHMTREQSHVVEVAGAEHRFDMGLTYGTLGVGCEFRFIKRLLLLSVEGGGAGIGPRNQKFVSPDLEVDFAKVGGIYGRVDAGVRFPEKFPFGGGINGGIDGFLPFANAPINYRFSLGIFLDWDGSRG